MAESLDNLVSQAVFESRLLERALHDGSAVWEMRWRGVVVPAERVVTDTGVTFYASFPSLDDDGEDSIWLLCNGADVRHRTMELRGRASLDFDWTLSLEHRTSVEA